MLTCKLNGRLGNQMFQMASTIGIAHRMGYSFGFDRDETFWEHPVMKRQGRFTQANVPWGYHKISPSDQSELNGYMQSEKYFAHCKDLVKYYLRIKKQSDFTAPDNGVAVHIRLGDYKGSVKHPVCPVEYYRKAMEIMKGEYFLFSDEPDLAEKILPGMNVMRGGQWGDAYNMTRLKRHIISNSTFAWWMAYLSGGEVIAPRRWFGTDLSSVDIYCKEWTVI